MKLEHLKEKHPGRLSNAGRTTNCWPPSSPSRTWHLGSEDSQARGSTLNNVRFYGNDGFGCAPADYRELAAALPDAFRPDIASALTNQSSRLARPGPL